jgi:hypothetical protein
MPEYLAPGVYIEEIGVWPKPIEGVSTSIAGFVGATERGPSQPRLVSSWADYQSWYGGYIDIPPAQAANCYLPYAVRGFFDNGGKRLYVARVTGSAAVASQVVLPGLSGPTTIRANGKGRWGDNIVIAVKRASQGQSFPAGSRAASWFRIQVLYYRDGIPSPFADPTVATNTAELSGREPDAFEDFDDLSGDPDQPNFALNVINGASRLVVVIACSGSPTGVAFPTVALEGGRDAAAERSDYVGAPAAEAEATGLAALMAIREVSLIAIPDEVVIPSVSSDLLQACDAACDRFAILSCHTSSSGPGALEVRPPSESSYGAFYFPWLRVAASLAPGGTRLVPATGHVAGIYARVDDARGVHLAPANQEVLGLASSSAEGGHGPLSCTLNGKEQSVLNAQGVNVIRDLRSAGRGVRVFGARTMSPDGNWKYVSLRRLFIFIERSIAHGTEWVVFEPNSERTWASVCTSITNFLRAVWRDGALMGATEEQAFFVQCDRTTMTQSDIDIGRLICVIGIAPARPAEYVIFRIAQWTADDHR